MLTNSQIRARARAALGGKIFEEKWLYALVIGLISSAISAVCAPIAPAAILIAGPLGVGVAGVFMTIAKTGEKAKIEDMFGGFRDFAGNLILGLMITLFTVLWMLLFIIPGIVKAISYSMAYYIKCDHPEYDWKQCIEESKQMTYGHKWQIFWLELSFIGWEILGLLCFGIGLLWVAPYVNTSMAEFYNQLKGPEPAPEEQPADAGEETLAL